MVADSQRYALLPRKRRPGGVTAGRKTARGQAVAFAPTLGRRSRCVESDVTAGKSKKKRLSRRYEKLFVGVKTPRLSGFVSLVV